MGILSGTGEGVHPLTEHDIQAKVMLELSKHGKVFRTNAGEYYQGEVTWSREYRQNVLVNLRRIKGLPKGFSDLMVVTPGGHVAFVETKTPVGRPTKEQIQFIENMRKLGCAAGIARSPEDALKIITMEVEDHGIRD